MGSGRGTTTLCKVMVMSQTATAEGIPKLLFGSFATRLVLLRRKSKPVEKLASTSACLATCVGHVTPIVQVILERTK